MDPAVGPAARARRQQTRFSMFTRADIGVDLFLIPMVVWDVVSRGRVHPVTLVGGLAVIASQPLRIMLSETQAWMSFAAWAVGAS